MGHHADNYDRLVGKPVQDIARLKQHIRLGAKACSGCISGDVSTLIVCGEYINNTELTVVKEISAMLLLSFPVVAVFA